MHSSTFRWLCLFLVMLTSSHLWAQLPSRSGQIAAPQTKAFARNVGCGGNTLFYEPFEADTLPAGWTVIDGDQGTPNRNLQFLTPQPGWQVIPGLKDTSQGNRVIASPSWYQDPSVRSNDWLVLPQTQVLPARVCFSFLAYAQDPAYPESFEVRISTTGRDTSDFLAQPALRMVSEETSDFTYYSLDLSPYAGQAVHLAIRHTSLDAFLLVFDDFRLAEVVQRDLAIFDFKPLGDITPGVEYPIAGSIVNRGLDTLRFDSGELRVWYRIVGSNWAYDLESDIVLAPNDTFQFVHEDLWEPLTQGVFFLRLYLEAIAGDGNLTNDTLFTRIPVGVTIHVAEEPTVPTRILPNPTSGMVEMRWTKAPTEPGTLQLYDLTGQPVQPAQLVPAGILRQRLDLSRLPQGLYLLHYRNEAGQQWRQRVWKQ